MTKELENKFLMSNVITLALQKTTDGIGEKFESINNTNYKATLEERRSECSADLDTLMNGILGELSKIKILTDEIVRIDELLEKQEG